MSANVCITSHHSVANSHLQLCVFMLTAVSVHTDSVKYTHYVIVLSTYLHMLRFVHSIYSD